MLRCYDATLDTLSLLLRFNRFLNPAARLATSTTAWLPGRSLISSPKHLLLPKPRRLLTNYRFPSIFVITAQFFRANSFKADTPLLLVEISISPSFYLTWFFYPFLGKKFATSCTALFPISLVFHSPVIVFYFVHSPVSDRICIVADSSGVSDILQHIEAFIYYFELASG